jgi:hypothetical protein
MCKGSKESWCGSRGVGYTNKGNEGVKVKGFKGQNSQTSITIGWRSSTT